MILGSKIRSGAGRENPNLTSGSRAMAKEIKVMDLNSEAPLDHISACKALKDNKSLYYMILYRFRN